MLAILFQLKTMELLQNADATHFQATLLFSMGTVSPASSQSCRSIDADAWCKWALVNTFETIVLCTYLLEWSVLLIKCTRASQDDEMDKLKERLTEVNDALARKKARARLWETMFVADRVNQENASLGTNFYFDQYFTKMVWFTWRACKCVQMWFYNPYNSGSLTIE